MTQKEPIFEDFFDFQPKSKIKAGDGSDSGKYPFYTSSNNQDKYYDDYVFEGDSLIFGTGGNASIHYNRDRFSTSTDCIVAQPKNNIFTKYVFYYLSGNIHILERGFKGAGLKHISKGYINNIPIPIPYPDDPKKSLSEQKRIAAILDKADAVRQKRRQAIDELNTLIPAIFYDRFGDPAINPKGWDIKVLSKHFSSDRIPTKCGPFGSALKKDEYVSEGIPAWTMDNIQNNRFSEKGCLYITPEKYSELETYSANNGDIIISRAGTVGKMCVVNTKNQKSIITTNLIKLSLDANKINPYYFTSLMTYAKERVGSLKTGEDGAYSFMNTGVLKDMKIPVPDIDVQNEYTKIVENLESLIRINHVYFNESDDLFNSLVQRAFKGEL